MIKNDKCKRNWIKKISKLNKWKLRFSSIKHQYLQLIKINKFKLKLQKISHFRNKIRFKSFKNKNKIK